MNAALTAIFRLLQFACPPAFRREYGTSMRRDFDDALRDELAVHGPLAALVFALGSYADLILTALRELTAMTFRDLVFAFRSLRKTPLFTAMVIATLALAIGANATVFSILRAVVLAPLPYPQGDRLVSLGGELNGAPFSLSLPNFYDLRAENRTLASAGAYTYDTESLTGRGEPRRLSGMSVTSDFFATLGVQPELGRFLSAEDSRTGAPRTVVISDALWRSAFQADPHAVGEDVTLDGDSYRVVGVAPASFRQPAQRVGFTKADYWLPVPARPPAGSQYGDRGACYFQAVGRLRDGVTFAAASADLAAVAAHLRARYPVDDATSGVRLAPLVDEVVGDVRPTLFAIFAAVAGVLLVACANVANLLLSRGATRDRELAVRVAIGASRGRIVAQLLTETFAFSLLGGLLGIALAAGAVRIFVAWHPAGIPRIEDVSFDLTAAAYTLAVVVFCTVAAGLAPAFALSRSDVAQALRAAGRSGDASRGRTARNALAIVEVALTLALVIAAGLVLRSFAALTSEPLGFDPSNVAVAQEVDLPEKRYASDAQQAAFYERSMARVRAVPGVSEAAWTCCGPFQHQSFQLDFDIVGRPVQAGHDPASLVNLVSPGYFDTLRIPLVRGRTFSEGDRAGAPDVVVVNEAFVKQYFPGTDALGQRITWGGLPQPGHPLPERTIVGVVGDVRGSYALAQAPMIYLPIVQAPPIGAILFVRTAPGAPSSIAEAASAAATSLDPDLPPIRPVAFATFLAQDAARARLSAITLASLAFVALVLALAGIFAVVSYGVTQRTHEFGIRMALGARASQIVRGVVGGAMRTTCLGVALGLIVAGLGTRFLAAQLYQTAPLDPLTFGAVTLLIGAATLLAAFLPAQRATRVDPVVALRYE